MPRDIALYVEDMLGAARMVAAWAEPLTLETFQFDLRTRSAIERQLFVLGEAAKQVPSEIRQATPALPWREMCALRDVLAHDYFAMDDEILWDVAARKVPQLIAPLEALLAEMVGGSSQA